MSARHHLALPDLGVELPFFKYIIRDCGSYGAVSISSRDALEMMFVRCIDDQPVDAIDADAQALLPGLT